MASDIETIFAALAEAHVRYLAVGGVAVVLHGVPRFTADLDLAIDLSPENVTAALRVLGSLGYRPRVPVPLEAFAGPARRIEWAEHRGMVEFSLWSDRFPATEVDLFVSPPFDFGTIYERAVHADIEGVPVSFLNLPDLIAMKSAVGRPRDLEDVRSLRLLASRAAGPA